MATATLDFERPLLELERQIEELKRVAGETAVDVAKELDPLEKRLAELRTEIYKNLTPMQRVQVARHPKRPYTLDYLNTVFTDFVELHGDRLFREVGAYGAEIVERVGPLRGALQLHALHRRQVLVDLRPQLGELFLEWGELLRDVHRGLAGDALHLFDLALQLEQGPLEVQGVRRQASPPLSPLRMAERGCDGRSFGSHELHVLGAEQVAQRGEQIVRHLDAQRAAAEARRIGAVVGPFDQHRRGSRMGGAQR